MQTVSLQVKSNSKIRNLEHFIGVLGARYGFRTRDYSVTWDGGEFEPSRTVHELAIVAADGRTINAQVGHHALMQEDAWKYIRVLDDAFAKLRQRHEARGI